MGRKKDRNAGKAVVKIRAEGHELSNLGIAEPIETDPSSARPTPNGVTGQIGGDPVGFGDKNVSCRRRFPLRAQELLRLSIRGMSSIGS